uniref:Uncharacterized protein n=1 Tax=Rhizophora mucronata TaxID=61149 RepID=A0A2P2PCI7_RHIMU
MGIGKRRRKIMALKHDKASSKHISTLKPPRHAKLNLNFR